jgi:N-methylhydantoinase A
MGLVKVGPDSAGAEPGPVCYGRGGREPTITDADLLLGYLSPDYFLGGDMGLDATAVESAIEARISGPLGMDAVAAAAGIHSIVNENMVAATRMYIAEKGRDPRRYAMIAFGGAGPVHAYGVAKLLKLRRIICPLGAGVTSALGFLVSPFAIDYVRSYMSRLDTIDWAHLNGLFDDMERQAERLLREAGTREFRIERQGDMRYVGQGFEIKVPLPPGRLGPDTLPRIQEAFYDEYETLFNRRVTDVALEAMSWRLSAAGDAPHVPLDFAGRQAVAGPALKGARDAYFPGVGFVSCKVYNRYALDPGARITGPAIVEERESTAIIGPDAHGSIDEHLNLIIDIETDVTGAVADPGSAEVVHHG